jgi:DNA-directed RNA polymerase specialized sigma24 family protein
MSHKAIAKRLGIKVCTVRTHEKRALLKLLRACQREGIRCN